MARVTREITRRVGCLGPEHAAVGEIHASCHGSVPRPHRHGRASRWHTGPKAFQGLILRHPPMSPRRGGGTIGQGSTGKPPIDLAERPNRVRHLYRQSRIPTACPNKSAPPRQMPRRGGPLTLGTYDPITR